MELVIAVFLVCATVIAHHAMSIREKRRADHSDHVNAQTKLLHEDMQRMVSEFNAHGFKSDVEKLGALFNGVEGRLRKVETARAFGGSV